MLSIAWEPEIRGLLTVIIAVVALCGSVYLILATNMGARLGLLVALAGLSGWMVMMGVIWMTYGIGLKGNEPSWKPAQPFTVVRDVALLPQADVLVNSVKISPDASPVEAAAAGAKALQEENWKVLPTDDKGRGQSIAATDEIIQVTTLSEFASIYGTPKTPAERYFYHSVSPLLNTQANVYTYKLPYGGGNGTGFGSSFGSKRGSRGGREGARRVVRSPGLTQALPHRPGRKLPGAGQTSSRPSPRPLAAPPGQTPDPY